MRNPLSVRLPDSLREALRKRAADDGVSQTEIITRALRAHLEEEPPHVADIQYF